MRTQCRSGWRRFIVRPPLEEQLRERGSEDDCVAAQQRRISHVVLPHCRARSGRTQTPAVAHGADDRSPGERADDQTTSIDVWRALSVLPHKLPGAWRRSNHLLVVMLANPKSVAPENAKPPHSKYTLEFGQKTGIGAAHWMVGQEEVIVLKSTITPSEFAHFKAVMMAQAH
jgi:hypothetical protein